MVTAAVPTAPTHYLCPSVSLVSLTLPVSTGAPVPGSSLSSLMSTFLRMSPCSFPLPDLGYSPCSPRPAALGL